MSEGRERVYELMHQAEGFPREDGAAVDLLEEAVRIADTLGEMELAYEARLHLTEAACWSGRLDRMIVAFAWCLAYYDRTGDENKAFSLRWKYKWIGEEVVNFPHISREKITELFDDMASRYTRASVSIRPVHYLRCRFAMMRGDADEAAIHFKAWIAAPHDFYSNCKACEADERVGYYSFRGEDKEAVAQAAPMIEGKVKCA